jgi:phage-related tail protein
LFGIATALITNHVQRATARDARWEDRRAKTYLEVSHFLISLRAAAREAVDQAGRFTGMGDEVDRAAVQGTASIYLLGSRTVQTSFLPFSEAAVRFPAVMSDRTSSKQTIAEALVCFERTVADLLDAMNRDLEPSAEGSLIIRGQ